MAQDGPGKPEVWMFRGEDGPLQINVTLHRGQSIYATRDPIWFRDSDRLVATALSGATRWESTAVGGRLFFAIDDADGKRLNLRKSAYAVASDLVLMWTDGARFEPFSLPGVPGLTRASGDGQVWLLLPGRELPPWKESWVDPPPVVTVDPVRLAWVKLEAGHTSGPLAPAPGPGGRTWVQVSYTKDVRLFSGRRPGQHGMPAPQQAILPPAARPQDARPQDARPPDARPPDARPADAVPWPAEEAR